MERGDEVYFLYGEGDFVTEELRFALERLDLPPGRVEVEAVSWPLHSFRSLRAQALAEERLVGWCVRVAAAQALASAGAPS